MEGSHEPQKYHKKMRDPQCGYSVHKYKLNLAENTKVHIFSRRQLRFLTQMKPQIFRAYIDQRPGNQEGK